MVGHVRDSVKQVNDNSWLIDDRFLLHRHHSLEISEGHLWKDSHGYSFTISDAPRTLPATRPLSSTSFPKLTYDVGDANVVFDFGDALLRVKDRHPWRDVTPETVTLNWLAKRNLSFPMPRTIYYTQDSNRLYHIVSRVPGRSIDSAWRDLNDRQKQQCVTRVAQICLELSAWTAPNNAITGVDGNQLFDPLLDPGSKYADLRPENLLRNCQKMSLDTSTLVFNHNDLGPTNVMVDVDGDGSCEIGLVDWEMAGFVPLAWVRTKLEACGVMDFCWRDVHAENASLREWRKRVAEELGRHGVPSKAAEYWALREARAAGGVDGAKDEVSR